MTVLLLALDDTDNLHSPGTGRLARDIASEIQKHYTVLGVTRHQLYQHPAIPMTSNNSCAVIHVSGAGDTASDEIYALARGFMLRSMVHGSDPGIAVALSHQITPDVIEFGKATKNTIVNQDRARKIAGDAGVRVEGLGGSHDGIIGAVAGIGLAATGNDGRFVMKGALRTVRGVQSVSALLDAGIDRVSTVDGIPVVDGEVALEKFPRPALINGGAVLFVQKRENHYIDIKRG